jgi:hypothetical protein
MIKIATMNVRGLRKAHLQKKTDNDKTLSQNKFISWLRKTENDIIALTELGFKDTPSVDEQKKYKQILKYKDAAWTSDCALFSVTLLSPFLTSKHSSMAVSSLPVSRHPLFPGMRLSWPIGDPFL